MNRCVFEVIGWMNLMCLFISLIIIIINKE